MKWLPVLVLLFGVTKLTTCVKILAILPVPSFSHQQFHRVYMKELHRRGYNMTVATPNPINDPNMTNYREIDLSGGYQIVRDHFDLTSSAGKKNRWFAEALFIVAAKVLSRLCHFYLSNEQLMDIYRRNEKFDLFIVEWGMSSCVYPFAKLSDGKMIGVVSFALGSSGLVSLGTPSNPAHIPEWGIDCSDHMTFAQRLRNTIAYIVSYAFQVFMNWYEGVIAKQYFGPDAENLDHAKNVALIFDNSHPATNFPHSTHVNFIPLGGPPFHLIGKERKPLLKVSYVYLYKPNCILQRKIRDVTKSPCFETC